MLRDITPLCDDHISSVPGTVVQMAVFCKSKADYRQLPLESIEHQAGENWQNLNLHEIFLITMDGIHACMPREC